MLVRFLSVEIQASDYLISADLVGRLFRWRVAREHGYKSHQKLSVFMLSSWYCKRPSFCADH